MAVSALRTTTERNKLIAAILLGILAIFALYFAFGRSLFSSSATTAKSTPPPKPTVKPTTNDPNKFKLPSADEQALNNVTVVNYVPGNSYAPDAGRNIFAFYEPPAPTPYSPTPLQPPSMASSTMCLGSKNIGLGANEAPAECSTP